MINLRVHGRQALLRSSSFKFFDLLNRPLLFNRNASISSAIYKGIRRSNIPERGVRSRGGNGVRGEAPKRAQRPNHLLRLDAGEAEEKPRRRGLKIRNSSSRNQNSNHRQGSSGYSNGKSPFRGRAISPEYGEGTGRYGSSRSPFQGWTPEPDRRERTGGYSKDRRSNGRDSGRLSFQSKPFISEKRDKGTRTEEASRRSSHHAYRSSSGDEGIGRNPNYSERLSFSEGRGRPRDGGTRPPHNQYRSDSRRLDTPPRLSEKTPLTIPYTTASSEFLYGTSVVTAALRSNRRQMYKLYVHEGEQREAIIRDADVSSLARKARVDVIGVPSDRLRLMDKMSCGRPHNGYILEASPLPKLPVVSVSEVLEKTAGSFQVTLGHQSKEDQLVNGTGDRIPWESNRWRFPLVLLLDGILDPGNLGNILRSAYFLGVDAVAVSTRHSAPLSPITLKASTGASEYIPIFSVNHPGHFIDASTKNGWRFYAAVAPPPAKSPKSQTYLSSSSIHHDSPLAKHPCVLVLGGEGEGLRQNLRRKVGYEIGIESGRTSVERVDSLNVSVAAGMLCEAFLRKPREMVRREESEENRARLF